MDFNIEVEDVGVAFLQELWNQVTFQTIKLASETTNVVLEKDSFQEFSRAISELNVLLQALNAERVIAAMGSEPTKVALETLSTQLNEASKIIKDCKSGSRLRLLLHSRSVLLQMQSLSREIANTISSMQLVNLDIALNLKSKTNQIINNMISIEFRSAAATETIASAIENSINQNAKNRENAQKLLEKIAEATGPSANATLVKNELALLKQEIEDLEAQKKQAEALQLSQLIQLLNSTEIVVSPQDDEIARLQQQYPIEPFICPLSNEVMTDPVAIICGHSFERKVIQEHFEGDARSCPICKQELSSIELTPNLSLRSSIEEWKQRDTILTFQAAAAGITSNDHSRQNKALEDIQVLVEIPSYAEKVAEEGLIPKLVEILKDNRLNKVAALKCLYYLAKYCKNYKEAIVKAGALRCIVKQLYKGEAEFDAVGILLELSVKESLADEIGNSKDSITLLVSLLHNKNPEISKRAQKVLQNLSFNTHFAVKMAEAGYFKPFVARFSEGPQDARALMAAAFIQMQLNESDINDLKDEQFIHNLIQMLSSSSPACKLVSLKSIKKLVGYPTMVKNLLADHGTIPLLLGLISFVKSDPLWKQEAAEILALLIEASQLSEIQMNQGLQELHSQHNFSLFVQLIASSDQQTKIQFLHLLVVLSYKSEMAKSLVRSNEDAIIHLFSSLEADQPEVRHWAMKLIYGISEGHSAGVPLPPSPAKESAISTLCSILAYSPRSGERSFAAGIISLLPIDDIMIDEILHKSEALKAINEVICRADTEHNGMRAPTGEGMPLLENALAALLRYTEPSKAELQRQVAELELYPSLVHVLSWGTSLAKQRTAIALAHLSQSTNQSFSNAAIMTRQTNSSVKQLHLINLMPIIRRCCSASSEFQSVCFIHGAACSPRQTFCLVKADALKPLVQILSDRESGVAEAAMLALETLLTDNNSLSQAVAAIADSQGVVAILQVLEKGSLSAKSRALDLFQKMLQHMQVSDLLFQRSERILIQLLQEDVLKKKAALVLRQMNIIPEQSSYF